MPIVQTPLVRKVAGCTTIAHLSDFHTRADTQYQSSTWAALREDLVSARDRIDLMVVTGDLIDNPFLEQVTEVSAARAFAGACGFLRQLCAALDLNPVHALSVIAGNHDYRSQGLFFKDGNPALFAQCFGDYVGHRVHPAPRLAAFSFDSNADYSNLGLATGYVKPESIIAFASEIETLKKMCADWAGLVKCALVHHHAMPIGPTETRESILGLAEHVLLKNAGVFLEEMVKARIDYILHGHQHYPALSKACYPIGPDEFHTVGVIGAGSAGVGKPPSYS